MPNIKMIMLQEQNEKRYSRKNIDGYIRDELLADAEIVELIAMGVQLIEEYRAKTYYASKNARVAQLANLDINELVTEIIIGISYCMGATLFTSVTAQLAGRLHFNDKTDAIKTVAEMVAVLCVTDLFDIDKADKGSSLMIKSNIGFSEKLMHYIETSEYLPPMVCIPKELKNNFSSGYLGHNESLILGGAANHHDGDLCLDVLNLMNAVPLKLNGEYISTHEEMPTFDVEESWRNLTDKSKYVKEHWIQQQKDNWEAYKQQGYAFYGLMVEQGNQFYLTHKVDKRGRIYASGYHISSQGTAFKKACVELADEELVTGVPQQYLL